MHLLDMGGTLAAATTKEGMAMTIFVRQDQEQDVWAFHYRIKLPVTDIRRFQERGVWCAKVVSEEGDVLVSCYGQLLEKPLAFLSEKVGPLRPRRPHAAFRRDATCRRLVRLVDHAPYSSY
jgi:hypothetical protein